MSLKQQIQFVNMSDSVLLEVRYKFQGDKKPITVSITEKQYVNLLEIPIIETCEIIGQTSQQVSSETKKAFNERIRLACKQNELTHTKYLIQ